MIDVSGELERTSIADELGPMQGSSRHQPHTEVEESALLIRESGTIRFYVRPRVEVRIPTTLGEVQRFAFTIAPRGRSIVRRISIGKKCMPDDRARDRQWAYVDRVGSAAHAVADLGARTYTTKTRGVRHQAGAIEIAHGTYAIARHRDHSHLLYELDKDDSSATSKDLLGPLRVVQRGSYIAAVFNPDARGSSRSEAASSIRAPSMDDDAVVDRFGKRRFAPLEPVFLDQEGVELVLIGGSKRSVGIDGDTAKPAMTVCPSPAMMRQ